MLIASSDMFYQRKEITAQSFLDQFETAYDKDNSDLGVESGLIGRAYTSAAMFYFRKGYKTKAKQLINTGLGLVPGNSSLTQLLAMIK